MPSPAYAPMQAPMSYPAPAFAPPRRPAPAAPRAAVPARRRPLARAKAPDEPKSARPTPLVMPSPEQLGVAVHPVADAADWTALHARIKELGIVSFHMDVLPDGRYRFTCWLPQGRADVTQRIEALAATEIEAVRAGLQRAARYRASP